MSGFSHLHVRSGVSYGYGVAHPAELARGATRVGIDSLAINDRDGLYGVPRFLMACQEEDLSPIVGAEITLQRPPTKSGVPVYFLLIEDEEGFLQATIFKRVYERYGHILHRSGARSCWRPGKAG